jgi:hypothetical protein
MVTSCLILRAAMSFFFFVKPFTVHLSVLIKSYPFSFLDNKNLFIQSKNTSERLDLSILPRLLSRGGGHEREISNAGR